MAEETTEINYIQSSALPPTDNYYDIEIFFTKGKLPWYPAQRESFELKSKILYWMTKFSTGNLMKVNDYRTFPPQFDTTP